MTITIILLYYIYPQKLKDLYYIYPIEYQWFSTESISKGYQPLLQGII